ncbi:prephenate dehydrogenase/arogenate dehydrogenase family protein [Frisingicoccus sp.]|uniref:prephenate dehydrogenase/arogenate dehydrogenase family protein n=1 Tax=Frisingicoccus sp. TaxID=1918627 RepID=UPI002EB7A372|nr:prephenate dehydrogenase [Frisingicoccus sp.]
MNKQTIGFIGLGLIGGSIAKALRVKHPEATFIAYNRSKASLVEAMADGTINQAMDSIGPAFSECDIIFLCAPVSVNIRCLEQLKPLIKPDCILTDVGSVKTTIHEAIEKIGLTSHFIGGHPMAGSEKTGYSSAKIHLLENAYYILTPGAGTTEDMLDTMISLVKDINALPVTLDYREHDRITAAISHLPHIIAYTLVNLVRESDNPEGLMRMLAAGGFKDITRIASSSPEMWQQICAENKAQIIDVLNLYVERMNEMGRAIEDDDVQKLLSAFGSAKDYRDDIPQSHIKSLLKQSYEIFVDLVDESGAIATIATILATNGISIMNIGIVHNREFQEGVLHIEFYDGESAEKATSLLEKFHYVVHLRK